MGRALPLKKSDTSFTIWRTPWRSKVVHAGEMNNCLRHESGNSQLASNK
jgi:hypothetical protein